MCKSLFKNLQLRVVFFGGGGEEVGWSSMTKLSSRALGRGQRWSELCQGLLWVATASSVSQTCHLPHFADAAQLLFTVKVTCINLSTN